MFSVSGGESPTPNGLHQLIVEHFRRTGEMMATHRISDGVFCGQPAWGQATTITKVVNPEEYHVSFSGEYVYYRPRRFLIDVEGRGRRIASWIEVNNKRAKDRVLTGYKPKIGEPAKVLYMDGSGVVETKISKVEEFDYVNDPHGGEPVAETEEQVLDWFEKHEDLDSSYFDQIPMKLSTRRDIHAFRILDQLPGDMKMVSSAEHDQIWLEPEVKDLVGFVTETMVKELCACGVMIEDDSYLSMFV